MKLSRMKFIIFILFLTLSNISYAQSMDGFVVDDDLNIGGDIFTDFNEDLESAQVLEDERYYRYGRFFVFQMGLGVTSFDGNRGIAYGNDHPSYQLSVGYFSDFQTAYHLGFEYSKHNFFLDEPTRRFPVSPVGAVDVSALRFFFAYRHYFDTANLGTAITYSNPYLTGRLEYWYLTNKYIDQSGLPEDVGGGLGAGFGVGLEFPLELKESYMNLELLFHRVNFHDKNTQAYRGVDNSGSYNGRGYDDLSGNSFSLMTSYVMNW